MIKYPSKFITTFGALGMLLMIWALVLELYRIACKEHGIYSNFPQTWLYTECPTQHYS